jgi:hypothetical protein
MPDDVGLRELGTHQLKDLKRPERIYAVEATFLTVRPAGPVAEQPATPAELRASHADRERVVQELRTAAGDGRLTAEELDARLEAALTARTLAELDPMVTDLTAAPDVPDRVGISCGSGVTKRDGPWVVPRVLDINVGSGAVTLDFREAVIAGPELRIEAQISSGILKLITRPGIAVDVEGLTVGSGLVRVTPAGAHAKLKLRVNVSGHLGSGSFSAQPARPARRQGWWRALWRRILGRS